MEIRSEDKLLGTRGCVLEKLSDQNRNNGWWNEKKTYMVRVFRGFFGGKNIVFARVSPPKNTISTLTPI